MEHITVLIEQPVVYQLDLLEDICYNYYGDSYSFKK
jgi:hypothetical protein